MARSIKTLVDKHKGETGYVICFGSSLSRDSLEEDIGSEGFDWELLRDKLTIGVNTSITVVPEMNYHVWSDKGLWRKWRGLKYWEHTCTVAQSISEKDVKRNVDVTEDRSFLWLRTNASRWQNLKKGDGQLFMSRTVICPALLFAWKLGLQTIYILGLDAYDLEIPGEDKTRLVTYANQGFQPHKDAIRRDTLDSGVIKVTRGKHVVWNAQVKKVKRIIDYQSEKAGVPPPDISICGVHSSIDAYPRVPIMSVFTKGVDCGG